METFKKIVTFPFRKISIVFFVLILALFLHNVHHLLWLYLVYIPKKLGSGELPVYRLIIDEFIHFLKDPG